MPIDIQSARERARAKLYKLNRVNIAWDAALDKLVEMERWDAVVQDGHQTCVANEMQCDAIDHLKAAIKAILEVK